MTTRRFAPHVAGVIVVGVGINLGVGFVVAALKLPFYLDSIGTVLVAVTLGFLPAAICALLTVGLGSFYTPTLWAYAGTALAIAAFAWYARRWGFTERLFPTIVGGLLLGVVSAVVSAPVTAYVWGGVSFAGTDAITALVRATGQNLLQSVFYAGISTEPIDKLVTSLVVLGLLRRLPTDILRRLNRAEREVADSTNTLSP